MKQDAWQGFVQRLPNQDYQFSQTQLGVVFHSLKEVSQGESSMVVNFRHTFANRDVEISICNSKGEFILTRSTVNGKTMALKTVLGYVNFDQLAVMETNSRIIEL